VTIGDVIKQLFTGRYKSIHEFGAELVTSFNNTIAYWGDDENGADVVEKGLCGSVAWKFVCVSVDWHSVSVDCQLVPVTYRRVLVVIPCLLAPLVALSQGDQSQFLEVFSAHLPVVRSTRRGGLQTA
jgi:hypothetical protein